jgi:putative DNA primase/helicase
MRRAIDIEPRVVRWLWFDRIPRGMISIVAGMPSGGKSLITIYLAAQVSHQADVLLCASEDLEHEMLRPRLEAAGANLSRVHIADHITLPSGLDELERNIVENNVELVIIDPVSDHLDRGVSRYSDSIRIVTRPLAQIAKRTGAAIVMVEHTLKSIGRNAHPLAAIGGGNSGLRAAARMAFIGGKDPDDDERVLLCTVKANLRDEPKAVAFTLDAARYTDGQGNESTTGLLVFKEECEFDVMKLLVKPSNEKPGRPPAKRARAAEWLTEYLYNAINHEALAKDLTEDAHQVGITLHTLDRAAKLDVKVKRVQRNRAWWWQLPEETVDLMDAAAEDEGDDE